MAILDIILNNIDEALIVLDSEGRVLLYNEQAEKIHELFGWRPLKTEESIFTIIPNEVYHKVSESILQVKLKKTPIKSFAERMGVDGVKIYVETTYYPVLHNDNDAITHINVLIRDITMNKVFENKITSIAHNLTNLIERASAIIIGIDSRGYITDWNKHCKEVIGYTKSEALTKKAAELLLPQDATATFENIIQQALKNQIVKNVELPMLSKNGTRLNLLLSGTPRHTINGKPVGLILVGQDITELISYRESLEKMVEQRTNELKKALEKEQEAVNLRSKFVSMVSHEFRTPLANIHFSAGYLKKYYAGLKPELVEEKLDQILQQTNHMTHVMEDVLTIGKGEAKIKPTLSSICITRLISKIVDEVITGTDHSHKIKTNFNIKNDSFITDEKLLRSIVINLLSNAIKYSPENDEVFLSVHESKVDLILEVTDCGIGVSPEEQKLIFEPFHRANNASSFNGAGLGLSIVKRACSVLGGNIKLISAPANGSTFVVSLPITSENTQD
jgi:PAS domain S-box-containing protein